MRSKLFRGGLANTKANSMTIISAATRPLGLVARANPNESPAKRQPAQSVAILPASAAAHNSAAVV